MAAVTQLSVAIPNSPGKALDLLNALARAKVNLRALSVAENADLGIVRMVVGEIAKAKAVFKKKGLSFSADPVLAVVVNDSRGALAKMLAPLAKKKINIEYLYGTTCACGEDSCGCGEDGCDDVIILRVKDPKGAETALNKAGYKTIKP